jgi:hypothetical protein
VYGWISADQHLEVNMSNNKQSMKLYTEEELRKHLYNHSDEFFERLTPIQLPSDEEIQKESLKSDFEYTFRNGAKWMRDKIQGGNNEQR